MSSGDALTGAEKRCEPTTWMMSPAVMYCLALRTLARNFSFGRFDSKGNAAAPRPARVTGWCSLGCSSSEMSRSISLDGVFVGLGRAGGVVENGVDQNVMVWATRSKISSWSAMRKYITGVCNSSCGGRGTTGSTSWMNS